MDLTKQELADLVGITYRQLYNINKKLVFRSRTGFARSALQYTALAALVLAGNTLMLSTLAGTFGMNVLLAKIITEITFFMISWTVQRYLIFFRDADELSGEETGEEVRNVQKA